MNSYENAVCEYEGIVKNKKVYFAILAHKNEEALAVQVQNIRHFNPDAGIIIYNGGADPSFGKGQNTLIYPNSHPIRYGNLTMYFWEIMKWLEDTHVEYKYLINLDHDVLFVKHGFQDYLDKLMREYDVIGWDMVTSLSPGDAQITCCRNMWKEWDKWASLFGTGSFIRYLNSTQVYHHDIVRRMLGTVDHSQVEELISKSDVFALEEIFFATLAFSRGARIGEYPRDENWKRASRFRGQITLAEAQWVKEHPYYYWIHPVKEARLIRLQRWLMGEVIQDEDEEAAQDHGDPGMRAEPDKPALEQPSKEQAAEAATSWTPAPPASTPLVAAGKRYKKRPSMNRQLTKQPKKGLSKRKPLKARKVNTPKKRKPAPIKVPLKDRRKAKQPPRKLASQKAKKRSA